MKKLFTAVVALVICLSLTLTSFAAVTIGGTFTDGTDVYVYGSYEGEADEVGVKVGEKTYPLSEKKMFQANKFGKFVIGLRDAMNILGLEFDVAPYTVSGENEVTGEAVKAEKEVFDSITAVTVNGKMVSEFYQGTTETEFYYGLSELPEEASGLPPVAVKAGAHEFELKTEAEFEGWAVSAYHEDAKLVTVHFRKFAEFTTTALPKIHYHTRHHYIDINMSADIGEKLTQSFFFRTKGESIYDDTESTLGYTYYDVEAVEGYAPVAYNISRVYVNQKTECTEGVSVWNYDGDLSNETFTSIADISAAVNATPAKSYYNPVLYFKGFNPIEEYKVALISTQEQSLASFDSTTVKEGANLIIMKNETENNVYASFYLDTVNYPWKMTVKYVEKNPVDETMQDTSLAEIKVGGVAVSGVNAETKAYYYGVEDVYGELPEVTAAAVQASKGATVTVEKDIETKITVTAADGVTKETYTLNFRPVKTKEVPLLSAMRTMRGWQSDPAATNTVTGEYNLLSTVSVCKGSGSTNKSYVAYMLYKPEISADCVMVGASLASKVKPLNGDLSTTVELYNFAETSSLTVDGWVGATGAFSKKNYFPGLDDTSDAYKVGEQLVPGTGAYKDCEIAIDLNKLTVSPLGYTILIAKKKYVEGNEANTSYIKNPVLNVTYVEKAFSDVRDSDATLSSIKINGEEIEDFSPEVTTYYYPVESLESIPEDITAVATQEARGAYGEVVEYDDATGILYITGTSANGAETKNYLIKFKEIQTKEVSLTAANRSQAIWSSLNTTQTYYNINAEEAVLKGTTANSSIAAYLLFDMNPGENEVIVSTELNSSLQAFVGDAVVEFYNFVESDKLKIDDWVNPETSKFNAKKSYFPGLDDTSDTYLLGSQDVEFVGKYVGYTTALNNCDLTVSPNGYAIIIAKKKYVEGSETNSEAVYIKEKPTLTVKYYEKN